MKLRNKLLMIVMLVTLQACTSVPVAVPVTVAPRMPEIQKVRPQLLEYNYQDRMKLILQNSPETPNK